MARTPGPTLPSTPHNPADDPLEDLLADALAALDDGGEAALERFLAAQGDHATALRAALGELRGIDMLGAPAAVLPQRFGDFHIKAALGSGGMGVVYLAEQQSLGREVALKVVRPELLLFDGARERFRREIDAVARLEHPAIVPILATGSADGVPWYAMPRLRGRSGEAVVRQLAGADPRQLDGASLRAAVTLGAGEPTDTGGAFLGNWWQAIVRCVRQAALGIQHAHDRGVLHRDLKPSNLMITADGRTIVLDFGLAQARGDARLTRTGTAAGSPAYMAPEQLRSEPADERTDVYGLAASLHCLLGLRAPFPLDDGEALRQRILLGQRAPLRDRLTLPPELLVVLDCAMEVERRRRYPSAQAFADDLQAVLDGRTILARRLPLPVRMRRWAHRHRAITAGMATALAFTLLLPLLLWWQQRSANQRLADEVARTAGANRALAAQIERADASVATSLDAIEALLTNAAIDKLRYVQAAQQNAAAMLDAARTLFTRLVDDPTHGPRVQALRLRTTLEAAELASALGDPERAQRLATEVLAWLGDGELPALPRLARARATWLLAWLHLRADELEAMPPLLAHARADLAEAAAAPLAEQVRVRSRVLELEAALASRRGDPIASERTVREHVGLLEQAHGGDSADPALAMARTTLAGLLRERGEAAGARPLLTAAIAAVRPALAAPETGWPVPRYVLACALHQQASLHHDARDGAAEPDARAALQLLDELVRDYPDEPALRRQRGTTANLLAVHWHGQQRWANARPLLEQACADQHFVLRQNPRDHVAAAKLSQHLRSLSVCLRELADWSALATTARELGRLPGGPEHTGRAARDLLRCVQAAAPADAKVLVDEVLVLLRTAHEQGLRITVSDPVYAPVRDDPRFQALLGR